MLAVVVVFDDANGKVHFLADFVLAGSDGIETRCLRAEERGEVGGGDRRRMLGEDTDGRGGGKVSGKRVAIGSKGLQGFIACQRCVLLHELRRALRDIARACEQLAQRYAVY